MTWFDGDREPQEAHADAAGRRYVVAGREVRCPHCAGDRFAGRELPLGSRTSALLDTEWMAAGAFAMTCARCSAIQWFAARPERLDPE
jgi:hypothetical protein